MGLYHNEGFRRFVPERVRASYRFLRAWLLSADLRGQGPFILSDKERAASARISVVVAVHDSPEVTRRCLQSLEALAGDAEVIVVDDGSKLAITRQILKEVCARNRWKLVRNDPGLGHSRACEAGVLVSTRPYICLLNSDTVVTPRSWYGVARAFEEGPKVAVVGPSTSHTSTPQCVWRAMHCRHYWSDAQVWCFADRYVNRHSGHPVVDLPMVGGFAFFVRRSVWDKLGGFDQSLPDYGNESEFCRRVCQVGLRIVWTKASYVHHLGNESYGRTLGLAEISKRCLAADAYMLEKRLNKNDFVSHA
jgi:GT2 family glycosyltransferase